MPSLRRSACLLLLGGLLTASRAVAAPDALARGFAAPPPQARPWVYWFWLNGNLTREGLTADLEAMQRVGIGGALIMEVDQGAPAGPVAFAGPAWRALFTHATREAARLGLQLNMNDDAGWNGSGGPWITPDRAMQKVVSSELPVSGPRPLEAVLPAPPVACGYYREIAVLAFPTPGDYRLPDLPGKAAYRRQDLAPRADYPSLPAAQTIAREQIVDLSSRLGADGRLAWEVPAGDWTILRLGYTPTGAQNAPAPASGRGLECDKLSPLGAEAAFAGLIGKLVSDVGPLAGRTLVATHVDSWENGAQNWTARFREEFLRRRGYDLLPYLPAFTGRVVDSVEVTERFLGDVRQTVSDLMLDNYAGRLRELAREHGLRLTIEAYGDTVCDNLAYAGRADEPMGEFWWPGNGVGGTLAEMAAAAHVYGRPIVGAEAFTADDTEKWQAHPGAIKSLGDRAFCAGINRFVFHRYALQPWADRRPGMTMGPWGLHYERTQTWWEQSLPWHRYLARCQYLLRQGLPVVDVLCLAPEGAPRGYAAPAALERAGYKADVCSAEALLARVTARAGRLVLPDGMSYRLLVLPGSPTMSPELLAHLETLVKGGATVLGAPPRKTPGLRDYPQADTRLEQRARALWGTGLIRSDATPQQALAALSLPPDFTADRVLHFIHRRLGDTDLYFVASSSACAVSATCRFGVTGKSPQLWRPETGAIEPVGVYREEGGMTRLPLRLGPAESVFVVFRPGPPEADPVVEVRRDGEVLWPATTTPPKILVHKATWGPTTAALHTRDVTRQVQRRLDAGARSFVVAELVEEGDPAPNVLKTLRVEYLAGDRVLTASATDPQRISFGGTPGDRLTVRRALWGPAGEDLDLEKRTKDVTAQVQRLVDAGTMAFVVAELASEGDPAPNVVKTLRLQYEVGGRVLAATATDPEQVAFELPADAAPPLELVVGAKGQLRAVAGAAGSYRLRTRAGRSLRFGSPGGRALPVTGPWVLRLPPAAGVPPLRLDRLASWSEQTEERRRYFSGTAAYQATLALPAGVPDPSEQVLLDLGQVAVMAAVRLNGKDLGLLWKTPYTLDVTGSVHPGANALEVRVTNLWPNRLIGDEQLPEDSDRNPNGTLRSWPQWLLEGKPSPTGRQTFTSWRLWRRGDALLPSGLLGPVALRILPVVPVRK